MRRRSSPTSRRFHWRRWRRGFPLGLLGALPLVLSAAVAAQAHPSAVPEANPARPTVSTPATLTPTGYLQFENGVLYAANSPEFSRRLGINQATKLLVDSRVELLALFEPFRHSTGGGTLGQPAGGGLRGDAGGIST
jgi:hypothetical protein